MKGGRRDLMSQMVVGWGCNGRRMDPIVVIGSTRQYVSSHLPIKEKRKKEKMFPHALF